MYKTTHTTELKIELSKFCLNNCIACTYSKSDRNDSSLFDLIKFESIIKNFSYFCEKKGTIPDFQLGIGEVLVFDLNPYFDIIEKYNKRAILKISTTFKDIKIKEKIDEIYERFNNTGIEIIFDLAFDFINVTKEELEIIKELNIYARDVKHFKIYHVLKVSIYHENKLEEILENLKYLKIVKFSIDYIYTDTNKTYKLIDINKVTLFYKNLSEFLKKDNIKITNINNHEYNNLTTYNPSSNLEYFIDSKEDLYQVIHIPFGEFPLTPLNSNFKPILNNNNMSKEKFNNIFNVTEKLIYNKNIYLSSNENDVCFNCEYKYYCPLSLISEFSKFNNIEFSENYCIGLKNLN